MTTIFQFEFNKLTTEEAIDLKEYLVDMVRAWCVMDVSNPWPNGDPIAKIYQAELVD